MNIDIRKVSSLANMPMTDTESHKIEKQLDETLITIERLNDIKTENIEPTSHVTGLENVLREDIVTPSFTQEEALKNATHTYHGFFIVKAILEQ